MRTSNFALRLQPTLMEEARELAKAEGVALNQLINVAVAEKLATTRTLAFIEHYTRNADVRKALALLERPRTGEPPRPGDEVPEGYRLLENRARHGGTEGALQTRNRPKTDEPRQASKQVRTGQNRGRSAPTRNK
jgi:hypothetical protein